MADLRIADAPELDESEVQGRLKIPTGGFGNKAINMTTVASWVVKDKDLPSKGYVDDKFNQGNQGLAGHVSNKNNPHEVTKEQVGLGNVDNTADADKPISNATSAALNLKADKTSLDAKADKTELQGLATTTQLDAKADKTQLDAKADKSTTYTKTEVDGVVNDLYQSLEDNFVANGAALPYDPQVTYNNGAIVVDGGALKKVEGGALVNAVDAESVSLGDITLDVFASDTKSKQDVMKATSVNVLDFLTKQQLRDWLFDNKSVDMTAAMQAAYDEILTVRTLNSDFAPLSLNGWGCGKIVLPKGRIYISNQILAKASSLGVTIEGQGAYTTSIIYNKDDGNLFKMTAYAYLSLSNLAILHLPVSQNREDWSNKVFEISGQSGGRKFYLDRVAVHNFASVVDYQFAVNEDTNQFERCTFTNCKNVIRSRNSQAVVNNFNLCTFVGVINRVFDISGYGYTSLRDCNIVVQGTTFYIANGNQGASSQYTLENVKWEWWGTGQASIIETEDLITNVCYFKLKNCGISRGVAPLASSYTFDIRCGRIQLEVDGGQWQEATMRLKSASTMFATNDAFIRFKDSTAPILPTNITYELRAVGTSHIPVIFDNCREVDNICLLGGGKLAEQARNLGAGNLRKSTNTKTGVTGDIVSSASKSHTFNFYNQTQYVESLRFIVYGYTTLTNCIVKVYKDVNKTQLICEQAIPDSGVFPQYEVIDFTLTDKISTDGIFIDITRDGTNGGIFGAIELITTAI